VFRAAAGNYVKGAGTADALRQAWRRLPALCGSAPWRLPMTSADISKPSSRRPLKQGASLMGGTLPRQSDKIDTLENPTLAREMKL
jgi:hypothetical protein